MILAPLEVDILRVGGGAQNLRIAVGEVLVALSELGDLRGADEREVHGPEEENLPFGEVGPVGDFLELLAGFKAHDGLKCERRKTIANGKHEVSPEGLLGAASGRT